MSSPGFCIYRKMRLSNCDKKRKHTIDLLFLMEREQNTVKIQEERGRLLVEYAESLVYNR